MAHGVRPYEVIHLGGQAAVVVPVSDFPAVAGPGTGRQPMPRGGIGTSPSIPAPIAHSHWPGSTVVGGPAGHADYVQHQYPSEGLVLVLRVAPCQPGGKGRRPASGGVALPAQLGSHPPQP